MINTKAYIVLMLLFLLKTLCVYSSRAAILVATMQSHKLKCVSVETIEII